MGYSERGSVPSEQESDTTRPLTRRERAGLIAGSILGGAYIGSFATALVLEHIPVEIPSNDFGYAIAAGALATALLAGEETYRATRERFNIPINQ